MAYRNKADTIAEAKRLGINIDGMDWPTMQREVSKALRAEEIKESLVKNDFEKQHDAATRVEVDPNLIPYLGYTVEIAPQMFPDPNRIIRYPEVLGDDLLIEEKSFKAGSVGDSEYKASRDWTSGTFKIVGKSGQRVVAESSVPKENAGATYSFSFDWFPRIEFNNRVGYPMHAYAGHPGFKDLLKQSGYWVEYKDLLKDEPNVFYLTGKLCVNVDVAHSIMRDIMRKEHIKRERGEVF